MADRILLMLVFFLCRELLAVHKPAKLPGLASVTALPLECVEPCSKDWAAPLMLTSRAESEAGETLFGGAVDAGKLTIGAAAMSEVGRPTGSSTLSCMTSNLKMAPSCQASNI